MIETRAIRLAAEQYQLLQCAALIKLYEEGRLNELPNGPVDPAAVFTPLELRRKIEEINREHTACFE